MKLYDIYKKKDSNQLIQITSFATHMNKFVSDMVIVFANIEKHNKFEIGSCPSFNGYGTQEEIENEYELFIPQEELINYSDWNKIFDLLDRN